MSFESIREDIVDHLEKHFAIKDTDCEDTQVLRCRNAPKSFFIGKIMKTNIRPPCTNTVVFSPSNYSSPSENLLAYIERDEEEESGSLVPLSRHNELELARMVR